MSTPRRFKFRNIHVRFEPRDAWIGVYWTFSKLSPFPESDMRSFMVYVCIIPFFPIVLTWNNSFAR